MFVILTKILAGHTFNFHIPIKFKMIKMYYTISRYKVVVYKEIYEKYLFTQKLYL